MTLLIYFNLLFQNKRKTLLLVQNDTGSTKHVCFIVSLFFLFYRYKNNVLRSCSNNYNTEVATVILLTINHAILKKNLFFQLRCKGMHIFSVYTSDILFHQVVVELKCKSVINPLHSCSKPGAITTQVRSCAYIVHIE